MKVGLLVILLAAMVGCGETQEKKNPSSVPGEFTLVSALSEHTMAQVQLEQFIDFTCAHCYKAAGGMQKLAADYGDKLVLRTVPIQLSQGDDAYVRLYHVAHKAGRASEAMALMYDAQFVQKRSLLDRAVVGQLARELGLDRAFESERDAAWVNAAIARDSDLARRYGISSTPSWVVAEQLKVGTSFSNLRTVIDGLLKP